MIIRVKLEAEYELLVTVKTVNKVMVKNPIQKTHFRLEISKSKSF